MERELTPEEKRQFDMKRTNLFKATISVIVIYGAILLLLSLVGIFSEQARETIFVDGFVFTVTFMAGVILVIIMLLIQVFTYKQAPKEIVAGENMVCPEYWELKKTPRAMINTITDKQAKGMSTYYCESPDTTFSSLGLQVQQSSPPTTEQTNLSSVANVYNTSTNLSGGTTNTYKLTCNRLYPEYMAYMDNKIFPDEPTKLRKEYLRQCKETDQDPAVNDQRKKVAIDWPAVSP